MKPWARSANRGVHCTPRRSIFLAVVATSVVWMVAVVYFLASEERSQEASAVHLEGKLRTAGLQALDRNRELSDEELRELHRQEGEDLERAKADGREVPVANLLRKRLDLMQEMERARLNRHGQQGGGEQVQKMSAEERQQEHDFFNKRMREAEAAELAERRQGVNAQGRRPYARRGKFPLNGGRLGDREDAIGAARDGVIVAHGDQQDNVFPTRSAADGEDGGDKQLELKHVHGRHDDNGVHSNSEESEEAAVAGVEVEKSDRLAAGADEPREIVVHDSNEVVMRQQQDSAKMENEEEALQREQQLQRQRKRKTKVAVAAAMAKKTELSDQQLKDQKSAGYDRHAFNQQESDRIGDYRDVPDSRHQLCQSEKYPADLPKATIIICFHNEALSALRRTINTAIVRGGTQHILEVLLVDDASTMSELQSGLAATMSDISPLIRVLHLPERYGLIRGRIRGAENAKGKVVVFLDSHCECNQNWLVPLIARIHEDRKHVVCPVIDIINLDNLDYQFSPLVRGGFTWALNFNWENIPFSQADGREMILPARSPTMAGGLFAIERDYFFEIGSYDKGMDIWGGENLEISFRLWMCGGTLEIIPCSRVGHIFRQRRPYDDAEGITAMSKNSVRVAEVWLDEYKELYYQQRTFGSDNPGDISERVALRKRLQCKSFQWYLENITPDKLTSLPDNFKAQQDKKYSKEIRAALPIDLQFYGQMKNEHTRMCLSVSSFDASTSKLALGYCAERAESKEVRRQSWALTKDGHLQITMSLCLEADTQSDTMLVRTCAPGKTAQQWMYDEDKKWLYSRAVKKCVRVNMQDESAEFNECAKNQPDLQWSRVDIASS